MAARSPTGPIPRSPARRRRAPSWSRGEWRAIRLSGENNVTLPLGNFDRYQPFSLALWIKTPDYKDRAVIIHRSMAWTDAGSRGYQLLIEDGKLSVGLDPLLAGRRDRHPCQRAGADQPVDPRRDHLRRLEPGGRAGALRRRPPRRLRGRPRPSDQEHHRRGQRPSHRRPAVPRPWVQERPGGRDQGLRPRADAAGGGPASRWKRTGAGTCARPRAS